MKYVVVLAVTLVSQLAFANVMNVGLDCRSASGRTRVSADLPGDDDDASIAIILDGKKTSLVNESAQVLLQAGNSNIQERVSGGEISRADIATRETKTSYAVQASANGKTVLTLVSTGNLFIEVDREYGYRTGQFKAKLEAVNHGTPFKADLICVFDYQP